MEAHVVLLTYFTVTIIFMLYYNFVSSTTKMLLVFYINSTSSVYIGLRFMKK